MDYAVELSLQGGSGLQPIVDRVLRDMGEMPDGPGEKDIERLIAALAPLLSLILKQAEALPVPATMTLLLEGDATHIRLDMSLAGAGGANHPVIPQDRLDPLLPSLRQSFEQVDSPGSAGAAPSHLVLTWKHAA